MHVGDRGNAAATSDQPAITAVRRFCNRGREDLELIEAAAQCVEANHAPDQWLADTDQQLQCLRRLQETDDAR